MKDTKYVSPQEIWLRQALEARNLDTQVVGDMFDLLQTFFSHAKGTRIREKAFAAALLESLVLGTQLPSTINTMALLEAMPETSTQNSILCEK